ncbi:hypothetical protein VKT23_018979 [Stygiomarasmius scandens]|uniref:Uncharacterized protein n=1 Tax=Marasmiellus scandens TaxID=2682957 RepID=A0ABR1IQN3_9AGAR
MTAELSIQNAKNHAETKYRSLRSDQGSNSESGASSQSGEVHHAALSQRNQIPPATATTQTSSPTGLVFNLLPSMQNTNMMGSMVNGVSGGQYFVNMQILNINLN